jgi:hypothetical protein
MTVTVVQATESITVFLEVNTATPICNKRASVLPEDAVTVVES